jgi:hypothetical protein
VAAYVDMEWHPAARIPPMMSPEEFAALVASVRERGLVDPIVLLGGRILDGRHRHRACQVAGVEPRFEYVTTAEIGSPTAYVLARECRRHLTPAQRAAMAVAAKASFAAEARDRQLATLKQNSDSSVPVEPTGTERREDGEAIVRAARATKAGVSAAKAMDKIARDAPEVVEAVQSGAVRTVEDAKRVASLPTDQRADVLGRMAGGEAVDLRALTHDVGDDFGMGAPVEAEVFDATSETPEHEDRSDADTRKRDFGELDDAEAGTRVVALCERFARDLGAAMGEHALYQYRAAGYRDGVRDALLRVVDAVNKQLKARPVLGVVGGS